MKKKFSIFLMAIMFVIPLSVCADASGGDPMVWINGKGYNYAQEEIPVEGAGTNYKNGAIFKFSSNGSLSSYYWDEAETIGTFEVSGTNTIEKLYGSTVDGIRKYKITGNGVLTINSIYNKNPYKTLENGKRACEVRVKNNYVKDSEGNNVIIACDDANSYLETNWDTIKTNNSAITGDYADLTDSDIGKSTLFDDEKVISGVQEYVRDYITTDGTISVSGNKVTITLGSDVVKSLADTDTGIIFESQSALPDGSSLSTLNITNSLSDSIKGNIAISGSKLLAVYDISVVDSSNTIIAMHDGKFTVRIKMTDDMKNYDGYKVAYIKDGEIKEEFDATVVDGYIVFNTTHLSEYAFYGYNNVDNPNTVDNISLIALISLLSLSTLILSIRKLRNN